MRRLRSNAGPRTEHVPRTPRTTALITALALGSLTVALVAMPASATFPGAKGRISFARFLADKDGPGLSGLEVFSVAANGSDQQRLTDSGDGRTSFFSDWSPDGMWIAFDSDRIDGDGLDDVTQVYVMPWNGEAHGLIQVTEGPGFHGDPAWSPSGTHLAMDTDWNDYPAKQGIWIVPASAGMTEADSTRVTTLPAGMEFDGEPQYSPDGTWLAFTRFRSCKFREAGEHLGVPHSCHSAVFRVRTDGTGLQQLTSWGLEASAPDWSPDGTKLTFDSGDSGRLGVKGDIYVMNANGSGQRRLTSNPPVKRNVFTLANNPVWSPDGTKILFTQWLGDGSQVVLMTIDPNGANPATVVGDPFFQNKADWGTHS